MSKKSEAKAPQLIVGWDCGYSNCKLAYGLSTDEEPTLLVRPAQAAPVKELHGSDKLKPGEYAVQVNEEAWAAFLDPGRARLNRELHGDYPSTDPYKALFHAGLIAACQNGNVVDRLVTGLPTSQARDPRHVEALVARLKGVHQVAPKRQIEVLDVEVLAQPVGTLCDVHSYHDDADLFGEASLLVLDPGFFSVDWVMFRRGDIQRESSNTSLDAMSVLLDAINEEIAREHGGDGPGRDKIEIALQNNRESVLMFGNRLELAPYVDRAMSTVAPRALSNLKEQMRFMEGEALDFIIVGGGGARFYQDAAQHLFPRAKVIVADNNVTSNASGYWFHGLNNAS